MARFDLRQLGNRMARPVQWLLALAILWTLLDTVWFFLGGAETDLAGTEPPASAAPVQTTTARLDVDQITGLALFGRADAVDPSSVAVDAPETRLRLELQGVFLATSEQGSSAIVAERNSGGELYFIGDRLPGNAELVRVLADRIVLRRGGSMETLRFPEAGVANGFVSQGGDARSTLQQGPVPLPDAAEAEPSAGPEASAQRPETASRPQPSRSGDTPASPQRGFRETVSSYRERLQSDPDAVMRELGVETVSVGERAGVRVDSMATSAELARVGLRQGDVVLSVNGQGVDALQSNPDQVDQIMDSGSARLEIQRGDRRFFVTTRIPGQ